MLMQAIDSYLQWRRAGGYQLRDTEACSRNLCVRGRERRDPYQGRGGDRMGQPRHIQNNERGV